MLFNRLTTKIFLSLVLGLVVFVSAVVAFAQPTPTINYQGKLTDTNGLAVADGSYNMRFYLYNAVGVATTSAIWTEVLTGTDKVQVTNGLFSVMLGSTTPLTSVDFNQALYLGVEIGGSGSPAWDGEMSPRKPLGTVPAAFEAYELGGVASSSFLRSDQADTASGLLTFSGGLVSTASSTITNLTTSVATTTTLVINGESFTDLTGTGLTNTSGVLTVATATLGLGNGTYLGLTDTPSSFTANRIPYTNSGATALTDSANFTFDGTNLGFGNANGIAWNSTRYLYASTTNDSISYGEGAGTYFGATALYNTALGYQALYGSSTAIMTGDYNFAGGYQALYSNTTGSSNNALGYNALNANTIGGSNNALGQASLVFNTTGSYNNALGYLALASNTTGSGNNALGWYALFGNTTGNYNNAIGHQALISNNGTGTIAIGYQAANNALTVDRGIFIGYDIDAFSTTQDDVLNIGNIIFGRNIDGTGTTLSSGNIGIGTSSPISKLTVVGTAGTNPFTIASSTGVPLITVSQNGYLGIGTTNPQDALVISKNGTADGNGAVLVINEEGAGQFASGWLVFSRDSVAANRKMGLIDFNNAFIESWTDESDADGGSLRFNTDNLSGSSQENMRITALGNIGIGTTTPSSKLTVVGSFQLTGAFKDSTNATGTAGYVLQTTGTSTIWVATSTLGLGGSGASTFLALTDTPSSFTANRIPFTNSGATALTDSANFTFDGTNLGLGNANGIAWNSTRYLYASTTNDSIAFGEGAGTYFGAGATYNTALGYQSLYGSSTSLMTGDYNNALGFQSLYFNISGSSNFAAGYQSLYSNLGGSHNNALGFQSLTDNTTGGHNNAFGISSLESNTTGSHNIAIGSQSLINNTSGSRNIGLGYQSLYLNSGTGTIAIGYQVAENAISVDRGIFIGYDIDAFSTTQDNVLNIGNLLFGTGVDGTGTTLSSGNIGIGTSTPSARLTVDGSLQLTGAFRDSTNATGTIGQVLQTTGTSTRWVATSTLGISSALSGGLNGYLARWTGASTLSTGLFLDNGTVAGINATTSTSTFLVRGTSGINPFSVASSTGTTLLTVNQNGRVGIGTNSPEYLLDVDGSLHSNRYILGELDLSLIPVDGGQSVVSSWWGLQLVGNMQSSTDYTPIDYGNIDDFSVIIPNMQASKIGLILQGATGQTGNLLQWQDDAGTPLGSINAAGSIGIGTSTPSSNLTVVGTAGTNPFTVASSTGTTLLTVLQNGNVGIGTTTPNNMLTVAGTLKTTGRATLAEVDFAVGTPGSADAWLYWKGSQFISASSTALNTSMGINAGNLSETGAYNSAFGAAALTNHTSGEENSAFGSRALMANTDGWYNSAFGSAALQNSTTSVNSALGWAALYLANSGYDNTSVGGGSLTWLTSGYRNVALGAYAGVGTNFWGATDYISISDRNSTFIGYAASRANTVASTTALDNATAIGAYATVGCSSCLVLGGTGAYAVKVGIGTTTPGSQLTVVGKAGSNPFNVASSTGDSLLTVTEGGQTLINNASAFSQPHPLIIRANGNDVLAFEDAGGTPVWHWNILSGGLNFSETFVDDYRLFLEYGGDVGIGTSTPGSKLTVVGTAGASPFTVASSTGDTLLTVLENGAVGLGTSNPTSMLDLTGSEDAGLQVSINLNEEGVGSESSGAITFTRSSMSAGRKIGYINWQSSASIDVYSDASDVNAGNMRFITNGPGGAGYAEVMRITSSGDIGIGTSTPSSRLTVDGSFQLTGAFKDSTNASGTAGYVLQTTGTSTRWVATSTLGLGNGTFLGLTDTQSSFTANRVIFTNSGATALTDSANFTFDGTNLGLGGSNGITWNGTRYLYASTTNDSIAFGEGAGTYFGAGATYNTALGYQSLYGSSTSLMTGDYNFAVGYRALYRNTTGSSNNALGYLALASNTTGTDNNAFGWFTLQNNTTGSYNNAVGEQALDGNISGSHNNALGDGVLFANTTGSYNIGLGYWPLSSNNGTGTIAIGYQVADNALTVDRGIFIGYDIDAFSTTQDDVLNIGNLIFGTDVDGTGTTTSTGNIGIGTSTPGSKLTVAGTIQATDLLGGATNLTTDVNGNIIRDPSDVRLKENIQTLDDSLDKLLQLRGVSYEWIDKERFGEQTEIGFIAQEVDEVLPEVVRKGGDYWSLNTRNIVAVVVEAVKELYARLVTNESKVEELENRVNYLESLIEQQSAGGGSISGGGNSTPPSPPAEPPVVEETPETPPVEEVMVEEEIIQEEVVVEETPETSPVEEVAPEELPAPVVEEVVVENSP